MPAYSASLHRAGLDGLALEARMRHTSRRHKARVHRTRYVNLRLTEEEHLTLTAKARAARMTKSELLRDHLGRVRITPRPDRREVFLAIARLGSNLNQLARWADTHRDPADALAVCLALWHVEEGLKTLEAALIRRGELEAAS
jgi:hypothetical protein